MKVNDDKFFIPLLNKTYLNQSNINCFNSILPACACVYVSNEYDVTELSIT